MFHVCFTSRESDRFRVTYDVYLLLQSLGDEKHRQNTKKAKIECTQKMNLSDQQRAREREGKNENLNSKREKS